MKEIIKQKINDISLEMKALDHLSDEWKKLSAQRDILLQVLRTDERRLKITLLKENQEMWDMGLITREEYENTINNLQKA